MKPITRLSFVIDLIAAIFVFLFLYTAISKLTELNRFRFTLLRSPLLHSTARIVAPLIPIIELAIVAALIIPVTRKAGLLASLVLMCAFTFYIGYLLASGSQLPCSCGGVLRKMGWKDHLLFNSIFTALALVGLICAWRYNKLIAIESRTVSAGDAGRRSRIPV